MAQTFPFASVRPLALASLVGASVMLVAACGGPSASATPSAPSADAGRSSSSADRASAALTRTPPVVAPRKPVTREYFGARVSDDYEWLEDATNEDVVRFTNQQNALARAHLDGLRSRPAVRARVAELLGASSADYRGLHAVQDTFFVLVARPPAQQAILVRRAASAEAATERVIVDPNVLDATGKTSIDFFVPSPDRSRVLISLSKNGTESGDLHVFDVATGKEATDVVARVNGGTAGGSAAWNGDGSGFYYTRYPRAGERPPPDLDFYQQVWFHKLGTKDSADVAILGGELPRIAECELERSDDGAHVLVRVANGDGGEVAHYVVRGAPGAPNKATRKLADFADEVSHTVFGPDGKVYAISKKGAPRGKVIAFAPPFDKPADVVIGESDGVVEDIVVTKGAIYLVELVGGPSRVRRVPLDAKSEPLARELPPKKATAKKSGSARTPAPAKGVKPAPPEPPAVIAVGARGTAAAELPIPPVSNVSSAVRVGEDVMFRVESYVEPPAWHRYAAREHRLVRTPMAKAPASDMSDVEVVRETCTSKDGTKVPISILRRAGTRLDGKNPTLLTGYGGYNVSRKPRLRPWYRAWLERGGVFAEANLRGGGEGGSAWHDAGKLTNKQNVFDDFAACAKALVDLGYTSPAKLAAWGRSNGGLLMGASIVQHPSMFRAVVSGVGIYDMLRVELSPNGAFNVTEFGSVKDEAQFHALRAYSPLHNVVDGTAYPAILFTTGANDPRVDPYHSRKMVARLQRATISDRPILLHESKETGHGAGTPLDAEIEETTDLLAFLFEELGVDTPPRSGNQR